MRCTTPHARRWPAKSFIATSSTANPTSPTPPRTTSGSPAMSTGPYRSIADIPQAAAARNRRVDTDPVVLHARLGVAPDDVDHVVLSHLHFGHIGNVGLFPNARFAIARPEFDFWTGCFADLGASRGRFDRMRCAQ
ncbi:MBL fold metallo-hydrolase [Mycolicibacterium goodii]|uniref:MBL fold metallo-hydrolase n=1 Tax=Mycolicibacterium goodii TaxID=134601 RepID=UPI0009F91E1C